MQVKIWNDNEYPFTQKYQDRVISIQPHKFVMMEHDDAHQLLCMFSPVTMNEDGRPDDKSKKKLRIDTGHNPLPPSELPKHICHACGFKAGSASALSSHVEELHIEQLADDDARDQMREDKVAKKRKPKDPEASHVQDSVSAA